MPHDVDGKELAVGDLVVIQCTVKDIQPYTGYCNVTLESVHARNPDDAKETFSCNAAVTQKVYDTPEEAEAAADDAEAEKSE